MSNVVLLNMVMQEGSCQHNTSILIMTHKTPSEKKQITTCAENCSSVYVLIVQSFYHKKRVNLGLIAREGFSNVSYIKKCALQHTKSLKESD